MNITTLPCGVELHTEGDLDGREPDDAAYVLIEGWQGMADLRVELEEHHLALIPLDECEPEIQGPGVLRVWCHDTREE